MADPLSITAAVIGLLSNVGKTSLAVRDFLKTCREARGDLLGVGQELSSLRQVLEWLRDDTDSSASRSAIPASLRRQIVPIIWDCNRVLDKLQGVVTQHSGRLGPVKWGMSGKNEVNSLREALGAHRGALSITLETITIVIARDIKSDTAALREDTAEVKMGQELIMAKIEELQARLPKDAQAENRTSYVVQRYLGSLSSLAGSVCDDGSDTESSHTLDVIPQDSLEPEWQQAAAPEGNQAVVAQGPASTYSIPARPSRPRNQAPFSGSTGPREPAESDAKRLAVVTTAVSPPQNTVAAEAAKLAVRTGDTAVGPLVGYSFISSSRSALRFNTLGVLRQLSIQYKEVRRKFICTTRVARVPLQDPGRPGNSALTTRPPPGWPEVSTLKFKLWIAQGFWDKLPHLEAQRLSGDMVMFDWLTNKLFAETKGISISSTPVTSPENSNGMLQPP